MENAGPGVDMISDLPDVVLHHILSSLPPIKAVRTSILLRRWRSLWPAILALHFNQEEFPTANYFRESLKGCWPQCLHPLVVCIRLSFSEAIDSASILKWLKFATERRVEEVELEALPSGNHDKSGIIPKSLLCCPTLRQLKLALPPWKVAFKGTTIGTCLTTVHLKGIQCRERSLVTVISSFPVLTELHLEDCSFDHSVIAANELKRLRITGCLFDAYNKIEIFTPKLQWFNYTSVKGIGLLHPRHIQLSGCKNTTF